MSTEVTPPADDPAIDALRAALEAARATRLQPQLLRAYAALGAGYLAADRRGDAESAWRTAVAQARICAGPQDLGLALLGLARTLARTPRTDRALLAYTEAVAALQGCDGARAAEARAELATLGRVPGGAR
ncbi:MAG: hypothetical protein P1V36_11920 [Planctomycetota bacterium]|nr:hypothetical protein [Planctomycetota bacterium]